MKALRCLTILAFALVGWETHAAVTCSVSVTSVTASYNPSITTDTVVTGSFTVSCTRLAGDPNTYNWALGADDGQQPSGQTNRAFLNGNSYLYEVFRNPPYNNGNRWRDVNGRRILGTLNFGGQLSASQNGAFDLRITAPQTGQPAGTYTDIMIATLRDASTLTMLSQSTFNVTVITGTICTLLSPPGNVNFTYTSFQGAAASAGTTFGVSCTVLTPYTMALDATSGTLLGLSYSLSLSQASATGNGGTQSYAINGSIAGGQVGTCSTASCSASQTRTLTITY
jgi:hypothetical protein